MATGDIYHIFVKFKADTNDGKERFTVEIGKSNLFIIVLNSITSQYQEKSDYIKLQYYPIRDWQLAGLKKASYIDIGSIMEVNFQNIMQIGKHIGTLSQRDIEELAEFIRTYKERLQAYNKANSPKPTP